MKFNTKVIHGGQEHDKAYGTVMSPESLSGHPASVPQKKNEKKQV